MRLNDISLMAVLSDAEDCVRLVAAPWFGVLALCALPYRFVQVYLIDLIFEWGHQANQYGDYLWGVSLVGGLVFLVLLYGRAVFVRACFLSSRARAVRWRDVFRVRLVDLCVFVYVSLLMETLYYALWVTFVAMPVFFMLSGLAAATAYGSDKAGLVDPFRKLLAALDHLKILLAMLALFSVAALLVWVNLYFLVQAGIWMCGGLGGVDLSFFEYLLRPYEWVPLLPMERLPKLLLWVGALVVVEPFWLAAQVSFVRRLRSKESGEDLVRWFDAVRAGGEP